MAHTRLQGNGSFGWLKALLVWLALLALLCAAAAFLLKRDPPKLVYPRPGQDAAPFAHTDALGYLNHLRREAGLAPFSLSPLLARSAADHARYLNDYPDDMHDEKHADHPYFRGKEPDQRVAKAGYLYLGVQENLSTGEHEIPLGAHRLQQQYLDGLMTAIYHRFSLLDPAANEAGIGFSSRNNRHALVVNQGNRDGDRLCRKGRTRVEEERLYYDDLCANKAVFYSDEIRFDLPEYTVYPVGSLAHPVFSNETPNPLPDREYSGNPVSISFNGRDVLIEMHSFELFQGKRKITNTRLLTAATDPNKQLSEQQFALFPLDPLDYDTEYRAVFRYRETDWEKGKAQEKTAEWRFRTRKPDYPYFKLSGGENLAVESGKTYYLRWNPADCAPDCGVVRYNEYGDAALAVHLSEYDGVVLAVTGSRGSGVRLRPKNGGRETALLVQ
ncbi:Cysteine-rich secretory protein family [Kingella potus]|uniref:Cysteine-rich secretory protein family n=1 Tax=Kingella potus TaxID=265175 RepID=A0A377QZY4_9NEIS|nr:CAP domain-containing protein [Kingella potus]STR00984.1 Cysteine-rich secretory protein family [Kingella potus]